MFWFSFGWVWDGLDCVWVGMSFDVSLSLGLVVFWLLFDFCFSIWFRFEVVFGFEDMFVFFWVYVCFNFCLSLGLILKFGLYLSLVKLC